ncbi:MAG: hypothetical protein F6K18_20195 [Okeania sp. SIO2C2]|uniref:hypothetical protein n=1 Tax=Okeania sp. SIO2C2 TaxID=2607787 RepID=UPI0013B600D6|nr:hypothetical protein [Okeania sp. SIO2C2]NEP88963.1 hypothetical protein [Okeania sp. SIO2C2]
MNKNVIIRLFILLIFLAGIFIGLWLILQNRLPSEQAKILEAVYKKGNYIEAGIWFIFSGSFAISAIKNSAIIRLHRIVATFTFLLFGFSDIVEVQTGAWWHPWWLFVWKSLCVLSMFCLLIFFLKIEYK